jgi:hypothetical protein
VGTELQITGEERLLRDAQTELDKLEQSWPPAKENDVVRKRKGELRAAISRRRDTIAQLRARDTEEARVEEREANRRSIAAAEAAARWSMWATIATALAAGAALASVVLQWMFGRGAQ